MFLALTITGAFLSGCATTSTALPDVATELPPKFVADRASEGPIIDNWWERFDDAELNRFINQSVNENPAIGQSIARLRQARAQAKITGANLFPQVNGSFNASKQRQTLSGLGPVGGVPVGEDGVESGEPVAFISENYSLSLDVSWEVDLWGRLSSQTAAARAEFLASAANLRATRQAIAAQTARGYFGVMEAEQQVALSQRVVDAFGEIARQVGNRADVGIAAPNDKTLAIANLQSAKAGLEQRKEALGRTTRQFEILLRDYPAGTLSLTGTLPEVPGAPPAGLPAELLARRPDVAASELQLRAAGYRVNAAERSFLPSINLTGSAGTASQAISNLLDPAFFVWSIAGNLLQPIFQGGRLRAQLDLNKGQRDEALESYAETVLLALSEVETALAVDENLARREVALNEAATAAERSVAISFNRYRAGIDAFLNVLESQQRALDSRSAYIAARRARLENRIDLHLALGGGFEEDPLASIQQE